MRPSLEVRSSAKCLNIVLCVYLQIRTVAAFGMEQITVDKYDKALELPEKVRSDRTLQQDSETAWFSTTCGSSCKVDSYVAVQPSQPRQLCAETMHILSTASRDWWGCMSCVICALAATCARNDTDWVAATL